MEFIGSIDQGTQSTRFTIYDQQLNVVAYSYAEHEQITPFSGWCEHDPMEILEKVYKVLSEAYEEAKNKFTDFTIKCIGITNQRETIVAWDKTTGKPLYNAIVWMDARTSNIVDELIKTYGGKGVFTPITGLPINTYFSAVKIRWLIENVQNVRQAIENNTLLFGTIDTWLIWNMTGGINHGQYYTDITNASRTMLFDIHTCNWSLKMLDLFNIKSSFLPTIKSNSDLFGYINNTRISQYNNTPITGCAGDQHAACIGQCLFTPGKVKVTFGTGAFFLMNIGNTPSYSNAGLLTTPCYQLGKDSPVTWALEGSIAIAGSGVSWLKDNLEMINSPAETEEIIRQTVDSEGVVFVPAFSGLFAPRWRTDVRAGIFGLTLKHTKSHIIRALLESIAFMSLEIIDSMKADTSMKITSLHVDGGMTKNNLFLQICSDILETRIEKQPATELTSLGAAIAAGFYMGLFKSLNDIEKIVQHENILWEPKMDKETIKKKINLWYSTVERCLNWDDKY
uniref:glycerol kinase n=1 Tax=Nephromyces sp. MMRI TaxID=2496275 RepID=A0A3Q8UCC3_9APIC|nr:glycerol kinase [Nephromyces sp. MMRI]